MEWYYAVEGERRGPIPESMLRDLLRTGVIDAETLVWREGFSDWLPLGEALSPAVTFSGDATQDPSVVEPMGVCAWSGRSRPVAEMLRYGDVWISPEYKDVFIQSLQEGGGPAVAREPERAAVWVTDLRLLTIVIQSARIWWANLPGILLITSVIWLPANLVVEYFSYQEPVDGEEGGEMFLDFRGVVKINQLIEFWIGSIATGAVLWVASRCWSGEPKPGIGEVFSGGGRNWGRMLVTRFIFGLLLLLILVPGIVAFATGETILIVIGGIYLVVAGSVFFVRHSFAECAAVANEEGGTKALAMSRLVTRGRFWRIVGYQAVLFGIFVGIAFLSAAILMVPFLDNFVVSGLHSTLLDLVATYLVVETMVFYRHLEELAE